MKNELLPALLQQRSNPTRLIINRSIATEWSVLLLPNRLKRGGERPREITNYSQYWWYFFCSLGKLETSQVKWLSASEFASTRLWKSANVGQSQALAMASCFTPPTINNLVRKMSPALCLPSMTTSSPLSSFDVPVDLSSNPSIIALPSATSAYILLWIVFNTDAYSLLLSVM